MILNYKNALLFLRDEMARRISLNPLYSQRAFARDLGLSPGELSEILRKKRALSQKTILKISEALGLNSVEREHFLLLASGHSQSPTKTNAKDNKQWKEVAEVSQEVFSVISDWYHFAILNLSECEKFKWSFPWIAKRLGLRILQVKTAVERMVRVGIIKENKARKSLQVDSHYYINNEGIPSSAVKNYHHQILDKAKEALEFQPLEAREFTGIGFALDPKHLPSIKKEIHDFQDRLIAKYSEGKKSEVYQLEMALFALTEDK